MENAMDHWENLLNPDLVRVKLISAGLFLVGHEMLIDSIKVRPREFFADHWTADGPQPGAKYEREVLALDPKGKKDALRGSIAWLKKMEVVTADDEEDVRTVTDARNKLAHELKAMVSGSITADFFDHFATLMQLVQKIERWWIINVEIATDPDYHNSDIKEESIISGPSWMMHMLAQVALGEGDEAWELHHGFVQERHQTSE